MKRRLKTPRLILLKWVKRLSSINMIKWPDWISRVGKIVFQATLKGGGGGGGGSRNGWNWKAWSFRTKQKKYSPPSVPTVVATKFTRKIPSRSASRWWFHGSFHILWKRLLITSPLVFRWYWSQDLTVKNSTTARQLYHINCASAESS